MDAEAVAVIDESGRSQYILTEDPVIITVARAFGASGGRLARKKPEGDSMESEVIERLTALEKGMAHAISLLTDIKNTPPVVAAAPATHKASGGGFAQKAGALSDVSTETLKVQKIYEDVFGGKTKWNVVFVDGAGLTKKIGTWDSKMARDLKAAKAQDAPVLVQYGRNEKGYYDLISVGE